jgi:hypothetical protein
MHRTPDKIISLINFSKKSHSKNRYCLNSAGNNQSGGTQFKNLYDSLFCFGFSKVIQKTIYHYLKISLKSNTRIFGDSYFEVTLALISSN